MLYARRFFMASVAGTILAPRMAFAASSGKTGTIRGKVAIRRRRRLLRDCSDVVVFVQGAGQLPDTSHIVHEIRQINREFVPRVSVVMVGTTLSFPNDDNIFHNVFSPSETLEFDFGKYRGGKSESIRASRPGLVKVYCDIHHDMEAFVLVVGTSHYDQTRRDGTFVLPGVPVGDHRLSVWYPDAESRRAEVTVRPGETTQLQLELEARRARKRVPDKHGRIRRGY